MDRKEEYINSVMSSIDGMQAIEASPYFFAKLRTKMDSEENTPYLFSKPALAIVTLSLFALMNILVIVKFSRPGAVSMSGKTGVENFSSAYGLDNNWNN